MARAPPQLWKTASIAPRSFEDLDWFCGAYKQIFARAVPALRDEIHTLLASRAASAAEDPATGERAEWPR